jgi:hypothetical protein
LVAFGGTEPSNGLPFKGQALAPAGYSMITPLTTLVDDLQRLGASSPDQKVLATFGLSSALDLSSLDPIAATKDGDALAGAAEIAGSEVYDTVSLVASTLVGAGGSFGTAAQDSFAAIANAINQGGLNLTDTASLSALIDSAAQTEHLQLGQGVATDVASVIAASNAALLKRGQADGSGTQLLNDTAAVELVTQGAASTAIQQAGNNPAQFQSLVTAFTGTNLDNLITAGQGELGPDDDTGEQAALHLSVNGNSATQIDASHAGSVSLTTAGLELEDSGTVTFTDSNGKTIRVNVNGGQTSYTANLTSLADGPITSTLSVNTDPAGNTFTPVAGNTVSLDQDKVAEPPKVSAPTALTVPAGGSTHMGIILAGDSDDIFSVSISGVPDIESVSAAGATPMVTKHGATFTYTFNALPAADWNNGLVLNSIFKGNGQPKNTLTVNVTNTTAGESVTAAAPVSIAVTDPPTSASSGLSSGSTNLGDVMSQFGRGIGFSPTARGDDFLARTNRAIPDIATLAEQFMGAPFVSGGASGLLPNSLPEEQRGFLALHQG